MAPSPVPILALIGIYVVMFALITGTEADAMGLDEDPAVDTGGFGGVNILGDIINAIISVVVLIFNALTFNVEGAPFWVQTPVAIIIIGSLSWSAATLIRGN
jgi:hypothetical protein